MKQLVIIILSILLLSACRNREHVQFEKLQHIDSIAEINADSAVAMIKIINRDTLLGNDNKYYFDLLEIRSNDKAYIAHTSDSAILSVINYFENHDFNDLLPVAYYYGGRVYSDLGDAPQALEYFQKALDCENISEFNHLKGKISSQMGQLFINTHLFNHAREKFKDAINIYISTNDSLSLIYNYNNLGTTYKWLDMPDSSIYFTTKALNVATQIAPNSEICLLMQCHVAAFYAHKKEYNRAKIELEKCIDKLSSQNNKAYSYSIACDIYCNLNEFEKAQFYATELLKYNKNDRSALGSYISIAKKYNNQILLYTHLDQFLASVDSLNLATTKEAIIHQNSLYNYQIRERENNKLKQEAQEHRLYLYITISGICILALLLFIFYQQSRQKIHKKQQLIDNYAETILELRDSINSNASSHSVIINELFEGRFSILNDIGNTFADLSGSITDQKLLYKEVKEIISRFENPKTLTELEQIINRYKNNLMQKFRDDFPSLSNDEYQQVCYHYAGFSPKFISLLIHQKYPTIYKRRTRIKEKIMASDSAHKEELIANLN
ncbi:MAG: hypothetical protein IKL11_02575 [Muribaculaceae bacterium]|nr:hypothetical protein [Muribaculaceae bacterium]